MLGSSHLHNFGSPSYDFHFRIGLFIFSTLCHLVILSFFLAIWGALCWRCNTAATVLLFIGRHTAKNVHREPARTSVWARPVRPVRPAADRRCLACFLLCSLFFGCLHFLLLISFFFFVYCPHFVLVDFCCSLHVRALFHNFFVALFMRIKNKLKSDQK